jgi:hypothetical protein
MKATNERRKNQVTRLNYEIRQIDALQEEEGYWLWNTSWHIEDVSIPADVKDFERALLYRMRKAGIVSKLGRTKLVNVDGSMYELQDRKTGEPLIAFIPIN